MGNQTGDSKDKHNSLQLKHITTQLSTAPQSTLNVMVALGTSTFRLVSLYRLFHLDRLCDGQVDVSLFSTPLNLCGSVCSILRCEPPCPHRMTIPGLLSTPGMPSSITLVSRSASIPPPLP